VNGFRKLINNAALFGLALGFFPGISVGAEKPIRFAEGLTQLLKNNSKILGARTSNMILE